MIRLVMLARLFALIALGFAIGYYGSAADHHNDEMRATAERDR